MDYGENICQAIDTIVTKRLSELQFDITDTYTVVKPIDKARGIYQIEKNGNKYEALAQSSYNSGDVVYVTIPKGLDENTKFITGLNKARAEIDLYKEKIQMVNNTFFEKAEGASLFFGAEGLDVRGLNTLKLKFDFIEADTNNDKILVQIIDNNLKTITQEIKLSDLQAISKQYYSLQNYLLSIKEIDNIQSINLIYPSSNNSSSNPSIKNVSYSLGDKVGYSTQDELEELKEENQKTIQYLTIQIKQLANELKELKEYVQNMS